jgi:hypothetical protein
MGLFDTDANKNAARQAADAQKKHQKKAKKQISKAERRATGALTRAQETGTAALGRGETKGIEAIQGAVEQGRTDLTGGKEEALGYYEPLAQAAGKGSELYGNFYGLGGAEGQQQAQENWQGSPLYQAMVGEGSLGQQALNRQAAARGNPYNGADTLQYQGQLAGRYLNDYTAGLRPYLDQGMNIANNQANIAYGTGGQLASQGMQGGLGQSQVYTGTAGRLSDLAQGIGTTQATGVNMPAGMGRAQIQQNMGQTEADMYANIVAANNAANQNKWGLINAGIGAAGKIGGSLAGNPSAFA